MATNGTYCIISMVSLIGFFTVAILIGKSYELSDFKTADTCLNRPPSTPGVVQQVGDVCNVWDSSAQKCLKGSIAKKTVNGKDKLVCEKKPIVSAFICLILAVISLIVAIVFGHKYYKNKSA